MEPGLPKHREHVGAAHQVQAVCLLVSAVEIADTPERGDAARELATVGGGVCLHQHRPVVTLRAHTLDALRRPVWAGHIEEKYATWREGPAYPAEQRLACVASVRGIERVVEHLADGRHRHARGMSADRHEPT